MVKPGFLTRMFLRDYAFVERMPGTRGHHSAHNLALIATSAWLTAACLAAWCIFCAIASPILPGWLALWSAPRWSAIVQLVVLVFVPSMLLDRKMRRYEAQRTAMIDLYSTPRERTYWWWTTASIVPLIGLVAACFLIMG
jgi:hypothetical protein